MDRIIMLVDMDCFYVQVEQRDRPETKGQPCAVSQYNGVTGGGVIAVSYEARSKGIKRGMRRKPAMELCTDLIWFEVPEKRGKADLTKYRDAGAEVIQTISKFCSEVERASIDEAYVDLTDLVTDLLKNHDYLSSDSMKPNGESFVFIDRELLESIPFKSDVSEAKSFSLNVTDWVSLMEQSFTDGKRLAIASALTYSIRKAIFDETGFRCSAGVAPNKTLAKLACSLNKPNKQTIVPSEFAATLIQTTPINKIRNLGGKLGSAILERFGIETLGQLMQVDRATLSEEFGDKVSDWLHQLCRGHDSESITPRSLPQSVGCSKNFFGPSANLKTTKQIEHWLSCLAGELVERLSRDREQNLRQATRLTLYCQTNKSGVSQRLSSSSSTSNGRFSRVLPSQVLYEICSPSSSTEETSNDDNVVRIISQSALSTMQEALGQARSVDTWDSGIACLGLTAGKFIPLNSANSADIRSLLCSKQAIKISPSVSDTIKATSNDVHCQETADPKVNSTAAPERTSFFKRIRVAELSNTSCSHQPTAATTHQSDVADLYKPTVEDSLVETPQLEPISEPMENASPTKSDDSSNHGYFTSYTAGDWMICDECGSRVSVWQAPEHSDFHVAQRLQREWSSDQSVSIPPKSSRFDQTSKQPLRKRGGKSRVGIKVNQKLTGSLDRFLVRDTNP